MPWGSAAWEVVRQSWLGENVSGRYTQHLAAFVWFLSPLFVLQMWNLERQYSIVNIKCFYLLHHSQHKSGLQGPLQPCSGMVIDAFALNNSAETLFCLFRCKIIEIT